MMSTGSFVIGYQIQLTQVENTYVLQFKSILPDRTAKFDISVAGPLAGAILSLSMLGLGLWLSVNPDASEELVQVPSLLFQGSLLLGTTSRAVLGYEYAFSPSN